MGLIDIGPGAIDRLTTWAAGNTLVDNNNPANDSGTLDTFEIWAYVGMTGTKMGTFSGSGTSWDDRDYETIGTVTSGAKRTFTGLNCDVVTNDLIGIYFSGGSLEAHASGFSGVYQKDGDWFGTGSQTYTSWSTDAMSLYGTGETVSVQTLLPGYIASGASLYAPQANLALSIGAIASGVTVHAPTTVLQLKFIYPGHIASTVSVYDPTVHLMHQYIIPDNIVSEAVLYDPYVNAEQTLLPGHIASTAVLYPLTIRVERIGKRYRLEIWDSSGNLLAILENAHDIRYSRGLNEVPQLDFKLPAGDTKGAYILRGNQIWLRELNADVVIERFKMLKQRDRR